MSIATYIFGIVSALLVLVVVIELLRRRHLRERHAALWLLAGVAALVVGIFPQVLVWTAALVGVAIPTNLIFFVSIALLFLVCLQNSAEATKLESKTRDLAEMLALQDARIRQLEEDLSRPRSTAKRPVKSKATT
ncbi:MAG TPA: DUF2304 domain-containing protein [Pseudolysinimonas sp.]|nr:DUF2304 domain-containing protein [Pseudolysinimonas sp.]